MHPIVHRLLTVCFPATCLSCRDDTSSLRESFLCSACLVRMNKTPAHEFHATLSLDHLSVAGVFEGPLRDALLAFKYHGKDYLASFLAGLWRERSSIRADEIDAIVPIPLSFWKEIRRGYNQAHLIAKEVARTWKKPVIGSWLLRRTYSPSQTVLSRFERFENANASFRIKSRKLRIQPCTVLLLDDVCTTGATLAACARLLKLAGAKRVFAGAIARELLK